MNRCKKFLEVLESRGISAALIHRPENMRYLAGYTGEGCLFVSKDVQAILTDFRYIEQAERQSPLCTVKRTGNGITAQSIIADLLNSLSVSALAVESDYLTHDEFLSYERALPGVSLTPLNGIPEELRLVKDESEQAFIQRAAAISCKAFENILPKIHAGMTEKQVQILLDYEMLSLGSEGNAFSTIAASGANGSLPHAVPSDNVLREGDLFTLDFGAKVGGYCSDMTRTVGIGKVNAEKKAIYRAVLESQLLALEKVKPGAICGDIDKIAREYLDARYKGAFGHSLGHGVGLFIHESPRLAAGSTTVLVPGHVVTIEPGVYIPGVGGCRIEDMAILTSDGYINPITAPKQLIEL